VRVLVVLRCVVLFVLSLLVGNKREGGEEGEGGGGGGVRRTTHPLLLSLSRLSSSYLVNVQKEQTGPEWAHRYDSVDYALPIVMTLGSYMVQLTAVVKHHVVEG